MDNASPLFLNDADLLSAARRAAACERTATAELVALLAEVDSRRLYLGQGYPSMFNYCTRALLLSEHAAYARIAAARASRRFPDVLAMLRAGAVTLTNLVLLTPHLTPENCNEVLTAAKHKSKVEVECLIAALAPQPDIATTIRRLPHPSTVVATGSETQAMRTPMAEQSQGPTEPASPAATRLSIPLASGSTKPAAVAPLSADRFLLRVTLSANTRAKLQRAQDLMRHSCPTGDPAVVIDRALSLLVTQLEKARQGVTSRPRAAGTASRRSRYVPAAVRRAVWSRDGGRCAFVGVEGRCAATGFLELHHVVPYSAGGRTDTDNLQLRCRAHNAYEATVYFGTELAARATMLAEESELGARLGGRTKVQSTGVAR